MRRTVAIIVSALVVVLSLAACTLASVVQKELSQRGYAGAVVRLGPVGYWKLDDPPGSLTAADSSSYRRPARFDLPRVGESGPLGNGATLAAAGQCVLLPTGILVGATGLTIAGWFKFTSLPASTAVIAGVTGGGTAVSLDLGPGGTVGYYVNGAAGTAPLGASVGVWNFVVLTVSSVATVYVDGARAVSGSVAATSFGSHEVVDSPLAHFQGGAEQVALWDSPLTSAAVGALYAAGKTPTTSLERNS